MHTHNLCEDKMAAFFVTFLAATAFWLPHSGAIKRTCENEKSLLLKPSAAAFKDADVNGDNVVIAFELASLLACLMPITLSGVDYDPDALVKRFSSGNNGELGPADFDRLWRRTVAPILGGVGAAHSALLVIDVQKDFISGNLKVPGGADVVPVINNLLASPRWDMVVYSLDWHPENHVSFFSQLWRRSLVQGSKPKSEFRVFDVATFAGPPPFNQTLWPDHCIEDTEGAQFHEDLTVTEGAIFIEKGTNPDVDSYSAFFDNLHDSDDGKSSGDTGLDDKLIEGNIGTVFVVGLATDYCVGSTALDALGLGLGAVVVEGGASAGVAQDTVAAMRDRIMAAGGLIVKDVSILTSSAAFPTPGALFWPALFISSMVFR